MSYSEPGNRATAVAAALVGLGVRPNERILIMLPDGPGFVDAFAGATLGGALPLPVNPELSAAEVAAIAIQMGIRLVLTSAERIQGLVSLEADPPALVDGPQELWAAMLQLSRAGGGTRAD